MHTRKNTKGAVNYMQLLSFCLILLTSTFSWSSDQDRGVADDSERTLSPAVSPLRQHHATTPHSLQPEQERMPIPTSGDDIAQLYGGIWSFTATRAVPVDTVTRLLQELAASRKREAQLQSKRDSDKAAAMRAMSISREVLERATKDAQELSDTLRAQLAEAREVAEQAERQKIAAEAQLEAQTREMERLKAEKKSLLTNRDKLSAFKTRRALTAAQLSEEKAELEKIKKQLEEVSADLTKETQKLRKSEAEKENLEDMIAAVSRGIDVYTDGETEETVADRLQTLARIIEEQQAKIQQLEETKSTLEAKVAEQESEIKQYSDAVTSDDLFTATWREIINPERSDNDVLRFILGNYFSHGLTLDKLTEIYKEQMDPDELERYEEHGYQTHTLVTEAELQWRQRLKKDKGFNDDELSNFLSNPNNVYGRTYMRDLSLQQLIADFSCPDADTMARSQYDSIADTKYVGRFRELSRLVCDQGFGFGGPAARVLPSADSALYTETDDHVKRMVGFQDNHLKRMSGV